MRPLNLFLFALCLLAFWTTPGFGLQDQPVATQLDAGPEGTSPKEARVLLCRTRNLQPDPPDPAANPEPLRVGGEVKRPEILFQTKPEYTKEARRAKAGGTVIMETIVDEAGCVRSVRVLQGLSHGLTESAVNAVRQWVFTPATLEGKPVKVYYTLTVNFAVSGARW
jgi:TonB family protein